MSDAVVTPGENLIVDGIPPIPAALAAEVERYTEFRSATLWSWHPTRREMLIGTRFGDATQIHRVGHPGGAREQLTFFAEPVADAAFEPTEGALAVFSRDVGGNERYQNYRYDFSTRAVTLLTDGEARNHLGVWSHAGDRMAYGSTRRNGRDVDLYLIDPRDPTTDRLLAQPGGEGWSVLDWSPDGGTLLALEYVSITESYLWLFDVAAGERTALTPRAREGTVSYAGGKFSKDGQGIYVATDRDAEFRLLAYIDLATREIGILTAHIPWGVDEFDLSPDGARIAFVTNEEGFSVLRLLDAKTGRELPRPKLPAGVITGLQWHTNGRDLGFTLASARAPADAYSLDVLTGDIQRWTFSETGGLDTSTFAEPELIRWPSFDGRQIPGFLYRPPARFTGKRPVVINIHGGPESQARPGFILRNNYLLNELGVAVLFPNIRGSAGYGKSYLKLDNGLLREDSYKDIAALLDWIATRPDLDAERILVTGGSYGGHMTLAVTTFYNDRIRCAIDIVGPSNLVTLLENTADWRKDLRRAEYGDEREPEMRSFLERIAPLNHVDRIRKPLFVIQGHNDPRVPRSESEQIVAAVRKNGTPVWYLVAKNEGHGFVRKSNIDFQLYCTALFVKEFLLG
jgi:dipeptidyl aminopeptidase/acylaminoacyl peptidase